MRGVVEALGARAVLMSAAEHDRAAAWVSHLPQLLVAEALGVFAEQLTTVRREVLRLKSDGGAEARFTRDLFEQARRPPAPRAFGRPRKGRERAASNRPGGAG